MQNLETSLTTTTDPDERPRVRRPRTWRAGAVIMGLVGIFLGIDVVTRIGGAAFSREEVVSLGFSEDKTALIGWVLLACLAVFLAPRTAVLGALGLTAYLGGAVTATLRVDRPLATVVLAAVYVGVLVWTGLILRRPELLRVLGIRRR